MTNVSCACSHCAHVREMLKTLLKCFTQKTMSDCLSRLQWEAPVRYISPSRVGRKSTLRCQDVQDTRLSGGLVRKLWSPRRGRSPRCFKIWRGLVDLGSSAYRFPTWISGHFVTLDIFYHIFRTLLITFFQQDQPHWLPLGAPDLLSEQYHRPTFNAGRSDASAEHTPCILVAGTGSLFGTPWSRSPWFIQHYLARAVVLWVVPEVHLPWICRNSRPRV